ncbi:unnamed protein product [Cylicostephanus goldi]|uniref:Uncharacterized protein n=1 Tax=Cylicostephanus goldi TaxID=71465 RepID=A0A3P6QDB6_CYLGO|nr:unnamed protein product [Cylicostephanus goldi]
MKDYYYVYNSKLFPFSPNVPRHNGDQPAYLRSETLRYLKEEEGNRPRGNLSDHPNPNGLPVCYICSRPIL